MEGDGHCSGEEPSDAGLDSNGDSFEDGVKVHGESEEVRDLFGLFKD